MNKIKTNEVSQKTLNSTSTSNQIAHINTTLTIHKSKSKTPPFLLSFKIFNQNVHNYLVDVGASLNVMPFSICKKLNATPLKSSIHIIQLEITEVKVKVELKDVLIVFFVNPGIHQTIDIIVVDISESYGVLLSRDWS